MAGKNFQFNIGQTTFVVSNQNKPIALSIDSICASLNQR